LAAKPPNLSLFAGSEIHRDLSQPLTETKNGNHLKQQMLVYTFWGTLPGVFEYIPTSVWGHLGI